MTTSKKSFRFVLVKPSRYDNDGTVVQRVRSIIPSNTLATLYGLALDCANRKVLGDDVEILIDAYDEPNTVIPIQKIIHGFQQADGGNGWSCWCSNQPISEILRYLPSSSRGRDPSCDWGAQ